jgi:hypothetical protein
MTTRAEWLALAERCEKATGPDGKLDCVIFALITPSAFETDYDRDLHARLSWTRNLADWSWLLEKGMQPYTSSLDAITALIERELTGWRWKTGRAEFHCWATIYGGSGEGSVFSAVSIQGSAALALCAAFAKAMAEKAA